MKPLFSVLLGILAFIVLAIIPIIAIYISFNKED